MSCPAISYTLFCQYKWSLDETAAAEKVKMYLQALSLSDLKKPKLIRPAMDRFEGEDVQTSWEIFKPL